MTVWFLILLGLAWAAVFIPAAVRAKQTTPLTSTERFRSGMRRIAPTASGGRWEIVEPSPEARRRRARRRARQRRRLVLEYMTAFVGFTLLVTLLTGKLWGLQLFSDAVLATYVVLLVGNRRAAEQARRTIRPLHRPSWDEPAHEERIRVGGSGG